LFGYLQRKQAYIKELEAKVKLQEMGRDEQIERLTDAVRVLLEDNDNLRQLLAGLGGYIVSFSRFFRIVVYLG